MKPGWQRCPLLFPGLLTVPLGFPEITISHSCLIKCVSFVSLMFPKLSVLLGTNQQTHSEGTFFFFKDQTQ